jgi:hypothetical protein
VREKVSSIVGSLWVQSELVLMYAKISNTAEKMSERMSKIGDGEWRNEETGTCYETRACRHEHEFHLLQTSNSIHPRT